MQTCNKLIPGVFRDQAAEQGGHEQAGADQRPGPFHPVRPHGRQGHVPHAGPRAALRVFQHSQDLREFQS